MGKPIAGRNKSPFGVDGINVDAAVLSDGTQLTNVRISKQRSIHVFDLISADGTTLYPFVKITGVDANGVALDVADDADTLVGKLAAGTFCISIVDAEDTVVGFAVRLLLNKVVLQNGSVVFLADYTGQGFEEPSTIAVTNISLNPTVLNIVVGEEAPVVVTFTPSNATNQNYDFAHSNPSIASVSGGEGQFYITGLVVGQATVTVTSEDGNFSSSVVVNVSEQPA